MLYTGAGSDHSLEIIDRAELLDIFSFHSIPLE